MLSDNKPIVAQILYSGLGGHGGVVSSMIDADKNGSWKNVLAFVGIEPLLPSYRQMCEKGNIGYSYVRAHRGKPWKCYGPVLKWLYNTKPSVVILHSTFLIIPVIIYSLATGIPVVVVEHQANMLKSRPERLYSLISMILAKSIVTLTSEYYMELSNSMKGLFRAKKVCIIQNGINTEMFKPSRYLSLSNKNEVKIGMAARFSGIKRFDILADAISILQKEPGIKWTLSLAGDGEDRIKFEQDILKLGITNIVFEGMLSGSELSDWYNSLDIYAHASNGETLSISVLQAMSCGLPILGSDVDGISNILKGQPRAGIVADKQSAECFARILLKMYKDPMSSQNMGILARKKVVETYGNIAMFQKYDDLIRRLIVNR